MQLDFGRRELYIVKQSRLQAARPFHLCVVQENRPGRFETSLMADFDTISKHLIQTYPADFARFTLDQDPVEVIEVIDTEQFTVEARQTDSLLRVRLDDEIVLIHTAQA